MGCELVENTSPSHTKTHGEILDEAFPFYLSIGMTYQQYWCENVWLAWYYREANKITIERKNNEMWLQGLYIYSAVGAVVGNALRKKGSKALDYIEKPIRITPLSEEEKLAQIEQERKKAVAFFSALSIKSGKARKEG